MGPEEVATYLEPKGYLRQPLQSSVHQLGLLVLVAIRAETNTRFARIFAQLHNSDTQQMILV